MREHSANLKNNRGIMEQTILTLPIQRASSPAPDGSKLKEGRNDVRRLSDVNPEYESETASSFLSDLVGMINSEVMSQAELSPPEDKQAFAWKDLINLSEEAAPINSGAIETRMIEISIAGSAPELNGFNGNCPDLISDLTNIAPGNEVLKNNRNSFQKLNAAINLPLQVEGAKNGVEISKEQTISDNSSLLNIDDWFQNSGRARILRKAGIHGSHIFEDSFGSERSYGSQNSPYFNLEKTLSAGNDFLKQGGGQAPGSGIDLAQRGIEALVGDPLDGKGNDLLNKNDMLSGTHLNDLSRAETPFDSRQSQSLHMIHKNNALTQVVERAVIGMKDGHAAMEIDLKPDILGRLKLSISTLDHQVLVKIFAEKPLTKEIIESGMDQLKTDLQNQGLEVGEFEVIVNEEFFQDKDGHHDASFTREMETHPDSRKDETDEVSVEEREDARQMVQDLNGIQLVNFFA
jgi:hypothetical protein